MFAQTKTGGLLCRCAGALGLAEEQTFLCSSGNAEQNRPHGEQEPTLRVRLGGVSLVCRGCWGRALAPKLPGYGPATPPALA